LGLRPGDVRQPRYQLHVRYHQLLDGLLAPPGVFVVITTNAGVVVTDVVIHGDVIATNDLRWFTRRFDDIIVVTRCL
jgi:hypothetical protein